MFVAIDGEADADGRYILMRDSLGRELHNPRGIGTQQAFEWLLATPRHKQTLVCFGLNYDANQWCADLTRRELIRLAKDQRTVHDMRYKLDWLPSKYFQIRDVLTRRTVRVCEVFGFYQTSFVKALKQWGFTPPREVEQMKQRRGTFTAAQLERVSAYCLAECKLLVALMERLYDACNGAGCVPDTWIGAGSIASKLLRQHGVKEYHVYDRDLASQQVVEEFILGGYFGGRVEMLQQGSLARVQTRDIRSAYPAAATLLPDLSSARVSYTSRYERQQAQAIYRVRWHRQTRRRLAPFPVRLSGGRIAYPASGEGCYHAVEVAAALACGYDIDIIEGWYLQQQSDVQPFGWVPQVFAHRAALKARGDAAEKALKLGLNSVYGKLAQGYGFNNRPPFQSYWWAGYITAATRARMLKLAVRSRGVCMISTDGIFSEASPIRGSQRARLGTWEAGELSDLFVAQPGVYSANGLVKSRGFFAREVDYSALRATFAQRGSEGVYHYDSRRFIGLRVAVQRNRFDIWRTWPTERRAINLYPERKQVADIRGGVVVLHPTPGPHSSLPYTPKQSLYDDPTDVDLENMVFDDQPHMQEAD